MAFDRGVGMVGEVREMEGEWTEGSSLFTCYDKSLGGWSCVRDVFAWRYLLGENALRDLYRDWRMRRVECCSLKLFAAEKHTDSSLALLERCLIQPEHGFCQELFIGRA